MNNQFTGPNAWDRYLAALEQASPPIEAIAVTDYYVTDTYREVLRYHAEGRLPNARLIFANVELRLDVATARGGFVNMHLFVSPEDPNHIDELQRLLSRLQFNVMQDRYDCTRADLIRLGKKADPSILDDGAALSYGANQFKVNFNQLREVFAESAWAKKNILIAVAGGANDGTSGVRESSDHTIRREIESFAHIIFASSEAQREFWLGRKNLSPEQIRKTYGGLKPCLHGSDAHDLAAVATPFGNRFSWIKGDPEFDSLRQAYIDPAGRAHVGAEPPASATPSQVISHIEVQGAGWMKASTVYLNPGLVAIIGARGSGKTALADMIAAGCDSISEEAWAAEEWGSPSFLARARPLLGDAKVSIHWTTGDPMTRALDGRDANTALSYPRARYLSQQFVEELCSASGITDGLLREIERVIFEAHPESTREGTLAFDELLELRASRHRLARDREAEAVAQISDRIGTELEKEQLVSIYGGQVAEKKRLADAFTADRSKLVSAGSEKLEQRHTELAAAANAVKTKLRRLSARRQTYLAMQDEVADLRRNQAPEALRQAQSRHALGGMSDEQWLAFLLDYKGTVDSNLAAYIKRVDEEVAKLKGGDVVSSDPATPYFADNADTATLTLGLLDAEMNRLEKLVSADKEVQRAYSALSGKIAAENAALQSISDKLDDAKGAHERAVQLQRDREQAYGRAFDALIAEQSVLTTLYGPLMQRLAAASATLKKLSFTVARVADIDAWASEAEDGLIDLRKTGPFKGKGTLVEKATAVLKGPWEAGSSADVVTAMTEFRRRYQNDLLSHSPVPRTDQTEFRAWSKRFAQWLFGTDHISIHYGIAYDGVDIRKLSPGTRGIVLLLLYLALDDRDDRPLIIDQPEENLDPKSVFDELVGLFIEAKSRRQVIMVTHNANLVINTDADQVIIAQSGPHPHGALPPITYVSGGLENADIRKQVCDILEGGENAFQERARC